jgi:Protein of unknown function (DUF1749)
MPATPSPLPATTAQPTPPPFMNYGILTGQLFLYAQGRAAFESPSLPLRSSSASASSPHPDDDCCFRPNKLIVIGGLSDGLLPVPYLSDLYEQICCGRGGDDNDNDDDVATASTSTALSSLWSIVQPVISSSYTGFGHGSLSLDCDEIVELLDYLARYRNGQQFALLGHSTGCQDLVYLWKNLSPTNILKSKIKLLVLQAPVSDREGSEVNDPDLPKKLQHCQQLVDEGQGNEMVPRNFFWAPITAQRFLDLHSKGGTDDFFSSDFTDDELNNKLSHISDPKSAPADARVEDNDDGTSSSSSSPGLQVLVAFSGEDEYVPSHVNKKLLTDRLVNAMNTHCGSRSSNQSSCTPSNVVVAHGLYLPTGNHNLSKNPSDAKLFVEKVSEMIQKTSIS